MDNGNILEIKNLTVNYNTPHGKVHAVRDVSFNLKRGEILAIVGESGCGKTALCKAVTRLLSDNAEIVSGEIIMDGKDVTRVSEREMRSLRGSEFSMVFQDPMTSLNPTIKIGEQIAEAVRKSHRGISKKDVKKRAVELMEAVGIDRAEERYNLYPHNFSGGMRQRVVIAIALAGEPKIIFADEPTTALDVTIEAQILDLLLEVQEKLHIAIVLVSHDLGVVAKVADRVAVMYAGKIVEIGTSEEIYYDPRHPYTWGLMRALPAFSKGSETLYTIPGMPPTLTEIPKGDAFAPRNEFALPKDFTQEPPMFRITDTHFAATWLLEDGAPKVEVPKFGGMKR